MHLKMADRSERPKLREEETQKQKQCMYWKISDPKTR